MQMLSEVLSEDCAITLDVHKIRQKHFGMEILQGWSACTGSDCSPGTTSCWVGSPKGDGNLRWSHVGRCRQMSADVGRCRQLSAAVGSVESKSLSRSELRRQSCGNVCMEIVGRLVEALECPKHLRTWVATCHHLPSLAITCHRLATLASLEKNWGLCQPEEPWSPKVSKADVASAEAPLITFPVLPGSPRQGEIESHSILSLAGSECLDVPMMLSMNTRVQCQSCIWKTMENHGKPFKILQVPSAVSVWISWSLFWLCESLCLRCVRCPVCMTMRTDLVRCPTCRNVGYCSLGLGWFDLGLGLSNCWALKNQHLLKHMFVAAESKDAVVIFCDVWNVFGCVVS